MRLYDLGALADLNVNQNYLWANHGTGFNLGEALKVGARQNRDVLSQSHGDINPG